MMPNGWQDTVFGDIAYRAVNVADPGSVVAITPYIALENISQQALHLNSVGRADQAVSGKIRFESGDVLFGKLRPYFRKVVHSKFSGVCSTDIWVLRPRKGVDRSFLFYTAASQQFVDHATRGSTGTKMPRADWRHVSKLPIQLPPLHEQQEIARILRALDDKIELNRRMNSTLEAMARALFQSWFVDFDPVHAKAEGRQPVGMDAETAALFPDSFEDSALGPIPRGWQINSIDEIANFLNGLALQKFPVASEGSLPVIKIAQLNNGHDTSSADRCSRMIPDEYVVQDGDILFSWSGSLEVEIWSGGEGALNQHLFKVTSEHFPKWFYYLWIIAHLKEFRSIASGKATTMGHIQRKHLSAAKVLIPSHELMLRMHEILNPILEQTESIQLQAKELCQLRDALLPKLLSGELRVREVAA